MKAKAECGLTLIEIMIAIAIVGILATIALPSYKQYVIRGNRPAAQAEMMEIANREQQYLLTNRSYTASLSALMPIIWPPLQSPLGVKRLSAMPW